MDASRVTQCLDSLWFYTNILTCRSRDEPVEDSLMINQCSPEIDFQNPITPLVLNQQHESEKVETLTPRGHEFGDENVRKEKTEKRKRKKLSKLRVIGRKEIVGGCDLGFNVNGFGGFLRFEEDSFEYHMLSTAQKKLIKMPPMDDDVAMKQHLKSWAYAVACAVK